MTSKSSVSRNARSQNKTTKNIEELKRKNRAANLQWAGILIVFVLIVLAVFVFGWGTGDGLVQHSG